MYFFPHTFAYAPIPTSTGCRHQPGGEQRAGQAQRLGTVMPMPRLVGGGCEPARVQGRAPGSGMPGILVCAPRTVLPNCARE